MWLLSYCRDSAKQGHESHEVCMSFNTDVATSEGTLVQISLHFSSGHKHSNLFNICYLLSLFIVFQLNCQHCKRHYRNYIGFPLALAF